MQRQSQAQQQRPRSVVAAHAVLQSVELRAQQHLGEIVAARGELIQNLALAQQGRFFEIVERARNGNLLQHRPPIDGAGRRQGACSASCLRP